MRARHFPAWLFLAFVIFALIYAFLFDAPKEFLSDTMVRVPEGAPLSKVAEHLKEEGVIRSSRLFTFLTRLSGGEQYIIAGDYFFEKEQTVFGVLGRVLSGEYGLDPITVLIPEGTTVKGIAEILRKELVDFDTVSFLTLAQGEEGYLFPDTYKFLPSESPRQIITRMKQNFDEKTLMLTPAIRAFGRSEKEVVIMASLLEKEARTLETRQTIAGILWKRLENGMPLQVDAVFPYINGKNTFQLSTDDLQVDHPYNTYTRVGLPPGPIANPGLEAIRAAITPIDTPYYYYLSDKDGMMHYARTFDGHRMNKERYLR